MKVWKKVWIWIKHHWYVPLIAVLIILFSLSRGSVNRKLWGLIDKKRDAYKKEVETLKQAAEEKKKDQQDAIEKHEKALKDIEKKYNGKMDGLAEEKKKEINDLVKKHHEQPGDLARAVAAALSAEYLKTEWERKNSEN